MKLKTKFFKSKKYYLILFIFLPILGLLNEIFFCSNKARIGWVIGIFLLVVFAFFDNKESKEKVNKE
ncbi:MAG: hypothetical protein CVU05_16305 [Bacteroidetes bacterium HGW-Bacteroidetes-21]|jgi:fatty-acid desaturase|nr:MAG: hypothetical protein CVU05_16305 [Bacteroidetes bacterium HGW-Bacteroidetes-21]